ncbi:hypothetical protein PMI01_00375, partial [Caulobacter sp. AP07]
MPDTRQTEIGGSPTAPAGETGG